MKNAVNNDGIGAVGLRPGQPMAPEPFDDRSDDFFAIEERLNNIPYDPDCLDDAVPGGATYDTTGTAAYQITAAKNAKTGENFDEYANYKVNLTVQLLDEKDEPIETCTANDYMVYTNAKVNNEYLEE